MRIAMVVPGGVDRTGEFRVIPALLALIERLARQHDVQVFALHQERAPASWDLAGARIHNIGAGWTRVRAVRAICEQHRSSPFELLQSIWSGQCGLISVCAARLLGITSLVHVAGGEPVSLPDIGFGGRQSWRGRLQEAVVLRSATLVTAASAPMIAALSQLGVTARRLPLGVDLDAWPARAPVPRKVDAPGRLIHVASLNRVKDQPTLLRAADSLARQGVRFQIDVVGEDTLRGAIQTMTAELQLSERIHFHGFLPHRQLLPLMRAADLMIISSRHEAGPLAMLEAAALGIPTVGTAVGHIAEWAPSAAAAVPVGDWSALGAAIRRLLANEELRLQLGREAQIRASREDADHTARGFQALYAELAAAGK